jgi:hypothetical protein
LIRQGYARWLLADLGAMLDLPRGKMAAGYVALIVKHENEDQPFAGSESRGQHLAARVTGPAISSANQFAQTTIRVSGPAHSTDDGNLTIDVGIEASDRIAFADYLLELEFAVTSRSAQPLGSWPIADWPTDSPAPVRTLSIACPGVSQAVTIDDVAAVLRASLKPMQNS